MKPRSARALVASSALLVIAACHDGSSGSPAPSTTNVGLAIAEMTGSGNLWLFSVPESAQGGIDRNGDGDALDDVVSVLDLGTGVVTPTSLDVTRQPVWMVGGGLAAIGVSEAGQGARDLNGDGDTLDRGLHVYDAATGAVRDLGISVGHVAFVGAGTVGFLVSEAEEGRADLDGNGSAHDFWLHLYDAGADELVNTELMVVPLFEGGFAAFTLPESLGGVDLNGDGDASDPNVVHVLDTRTRRVENLGLAADAIGLAFAQGWLVIPVLEAANGGQDLNGDGDAEDRVHALYDPFTRVLRDTGLSGLPPGAFHHPAPSSGGRILIFTGETDGLDRNGDGDLEDVLPVVLDPATLRAFDPGLAIDVFRSSLTLAGDLLGVAVDEAKHGRDLNGDHDLEDQVVHVADVARGTVQNLGFVAPTLTGAAGRLVLPRLEDWDGADWNADGDQDDLVPFLWAPGSGTTNTRLSTTGFTLDLTGERALFLGRERLPAGGFDFEVIVYDTRRRVPHFLQLLSGFEFRVGAGASGQALITVNEHFQRADLNADGDLDDDVLHVIE